MSKILESAILEQMPGAEAVHLEGEHVYVKFGTKVVRYLLSPEAERIALLDREGRPLDIHPGEVALLIPADEEGDR